MRISRIARVAAASFAAIAIAGPASAFTIEIDQADGSTALLMGGAPGVEFLRGLLPGVTFTSSSTAGAWLVQGSVQDSAISQMATWGPVHDGPVSIVTEGGVSYPSHGPSVPEPSAALLLALGMTVTGAHLRQRKAR